MASYHLSVKTIKRSAGRSVTAAAAYRAGERIECQREGRLHDYTRKQGIEETFIVAPEHAPAWAQDRSALWNAAEASETRRNSVTGREWELALPSEIGAAERSRIVRDFAQELVGRYGVAVDVAIHAPHREGDQRNHHAHVLTTTRQLEPEGFTAKTRVLDSAKTGGVEIEQMRGVWAELQNRALERVGEIERVDHRSLEAQRETARERGDELKAGELDRDPELKLGPAANSMERREKASAAREGREYVPVTERGAVVHAARQAREAFRDMRERVELARETYGIAREEGQGRVSAGLAALRAAAAKDRGAHEAGDLRERLARITGRDEVERDGPEAETERTDRGRAQERLRETLGKDRGDGIERDGEVERDGDRPSIRERLDAVLNKPRERLDIKDERERELEKAREIERARDLDRGPTHGL
ncbi:molybdopterin-guanine dinucleotide biosynthesis protein MobA [Thioclava dalianensis]|uniref:Molybdopterin-guanine dinucleotide biosynthesis protein MobA n=1 Tax=Thioclava dalianensis TaxID=1185766 RepID=A0A074TD77_9RHOB|nr:MobQ family relaxase [Thioclava dalianensis]KEP68135.1 molybdopterin-guanine dinucleotide biosynthesis protein MobA [Thioclava dalianensis]SFN88643.1 plasmid mobilization system relaxase [Thioclava dalianensis]